jgi:predicted nucleotidyltransferase
VLASGEREDISRIAAAHGARNVPVFGSVARGEAGGSSDLDLLVEMTTGRSLFDLVALGSDLEDALGVAVDFVTEKGIRRTFGIGCWPRRSPFEGVTKARATLRSACRRILVWYGRAEACWLSEEDALVLLSDPR